MDIGLTTDDVPTAAAYAAAADANDRWGRNRILAAAGLPVHVTVSEALSLLREHLPNLAAEICVSVPSNLVP